MRPQACLILKVGGIFDRYNGSGNDGRAQFIAEANSSLDLEGFRKVALLTPPVRAILRPEEISPTWPCCDAAIGGPHLGHAVSTVSAALRLG